MLIGVWMTRQPESKPPNAPRKLVHNKIPMTHLQSPNEILVPHPFPPMGYSPASWPSALRAATLRVRLEGSKSMRFIEGIVF